MIEYITAKKALSASWLKTPILLSDMKAFAEQFSVYLSGAKTGETEEFHKNVIKDFLVNTFYHGEYNVNTNGREDLVIFNGKGADTKPAVIIEAKSPTNTAEMFSDKNENCKALQECVYYFMQEAVTAGNREIQHIIITNYDDWYIFDARDFVFFLEDKAFVEDFKKFESKQLLLTKTSDFYSELAKPEIEKWRTSKNICVTHFAPRDFFFHDLTPVSKQPVAASPSRRGEEVGEEKSEIEKYNALRALYKVLSPEHLLRKNFANDANSLDQNFYEELLYIMGLEEVKSGGKKIIQRRKEGERVKASLIESAMYALEEDILSENERFETALHLCITWINRLLFLKLMESQQLSYQNGNKAYKFLTKEMIPTFDDLNDLFFKVLAKRAEERNEELKEKFSFVPYLNSSLFERSAEEKKTHILMSSLKQRAFPFFRQTVLKTQFGVRRTGEIDNLEYILSFLDAYNFSSESAEGITTDTKTLINASVLGLIFEKINGYKDGSFFTPSFITEYMAKEAIERAVIEKFNSAKGWKCKTIAEIEDEIEDRAEANEIFNTIRVLDPAVGSGHFLVSALNRLLFVKWQLGILCDKNGKRIKKRDWTMSLENDEISLTDEDGEAFEYKAQNEESQRVQETLFREKKSLIENCLFGVDINPASVYICRLRLWIELLKNAYYKMDGVKTGEVASLETLPNIDINIKCGNSLISKYGAKIGTSVFKRDGNTKDKEITRLIKEYREAVSAYKNEDNKAAKSEIDEKIAAIKQKLSGEAQLSLLDSNENSNALYRTGLEWMLEFPEVLDDDGQFTGFDVVIGNPPYISAPAQVADEKMNMQRQAIIDSKRYECLYQKWDLYIPFIELGLQLAKENAFVTMIVPFPLTNQLYAKVMRKMLVEKYELFELCDLNGTKVFDEATVSNCIPFVKKISPRLLGEAATGCFETGVRSTWISKIDEKLKISRAFEKSASELVQDEKTYVWNVTQEKRETNRHADMHVLGDYCYISVGMVLNSDESAEGDKFVKADLISHSQDEIHCKKYIEGKDLDRYSVKRVRFLEYGTERSPSKLRRPTFEELYTNQKLLINSLGELKASIDLDDYYYCEQQVRMALLWKDLHGVENKSIASSIKKFSTMSREDMEKLSESVDLRYLLGVMNSKYASVLLTNNRGGDYHITPEHIRNIPIPSAATEEQKKIIDLVDEILAAKQANSTADTSEIERKIDEAVYALYGLSEEEIATIEGNTDTNQAVPVI